MNMKITLIKALNKTRYTIYFSNDTTLNCNEDFIVAYTLRKDLEISDEFYNELLAKNNVYEYYSKALSYISKAIKSSFKVYNYLLDKGASKEEASEAVSLLKSKGLLNDEYYFKEFAFYNIRKSYGPLYIKSKAKEERIEHDIIERVLDDIDDNEYIYYIDYIARKYINSHKDDNKLEMKLKNYLYQRGYLFDMINREAMRILNEER